MVRQMVLFENHDAFSANEALSFISSILEKIPCCLLVVEFSTLNIYLSLVPVTVMLSYYSTNLLHENCHLCTEQLN